MPKLYLIPNVIAENNIEGQVTSEVKKIIERIDCYIVENVRTARRFIRMVDNEKIIDNIVFFELNKHTDPKDIPSFLFPVKNGKDIGLLSEAGLPCVADPGAVVVDEAHKHNIEVVPLVGPSSMILALMASGLNGQQFKFNGYLPIKKNERVKSIKKLERDVIQFNETQIFIEAPYRNNQLLQDIIANGSSQIKLCIACEVYGESNFIKTKTLADWKKKLPDLHKKTVVFVMGK